MLGVVGGKPNSIVLNSEPGGKVCNLLERRFGSILRRFGEIEIN
jgi:hypothetical protein